MSTLNIEAWVSLTTLYSNHQHALIAIISFSYPIIRVEIHTTMLAKVILE